MADFQLKCVNPNQAQPLALEKSTIKDSKVKTSRIFLAAIAANLSSAAIGTCFAWSSPVGPKLKSLNTDGSPLNRPVTPSELGWITSIFTIGALITALIGGTLADKMGRKKVLLLSSVFFIVGYIVLLIAGKVWVLIVGRFIVGGGSGFALCVLPIYLGEISTDRTRGATISLITFLMSFGDCYVYAIGPYVSYTTLQYFCLILPIVFDITFFFMPESPYYLVAKGERLTASKALQFLRGEEAQNVEIELKSIEKFIADSSVQKERFLEIVKTSGNRNALTISLGLIFFQQISGVSILSYYAQTIFESAEMNIDAPIAAIIVGLVQLTSSGMAPFVVNSFGRKTILLNSAAFMSLSLAALGYFFFAQLILGSTSGIKWLPVAALVVCTTSFMLGFGPVPWAVISELFPPSTKTIAAAMCTAVNWLAGFMVALFFPILDELGTYYAFWLFAILCAAGFVFIFFTVFETKDMSFAQIQDKLKKNL